MKSLRKTASALLAALLVVFAGACAATPDLSAVPTPDIAIGRTAVVVSESQVASKIGMDVLQRGGNSVDAAVAVAFALAVAWPEAGNIGGGGFMLIAGANQTPTMIDYRETAPAAATTNMFNLTDSAFACKAVGTPGTVRGLALAHQQFGQLPWRDLVAPAAQLAQDGFPISAGLAQSINKIIEQADGFTELQRVFTHPQKRNWQSNDVLKQPDLAQTLWRIANDGPDAFYTGQTADLIVAEINAADTGRGLITHEDLAHYQAKVRSVIHSVYRGYDIYAPPPPSSGGITLTLMLNMLETFDLKKHGRWSPETAHFLLETMRRAYLERARHLGDSDFVVIPDHLTAKAFARQLAAEINPDIATSSETLAPDIPLADEGESTTHFSIIDADGLAVANTYTIERSWGSRIIVRGGGFLLNNEMGDFNWKPGHTDRRGRIGTAPNLIESNKRMLSSMTPVIMMRDGRVFMVSGSPGGRSIINTVLQIVLNVVEFDLSAEQAVQAPRWHHQWLPDSARFELSDDSAWSDYVEAIEAKGHVLMSPRLFGSAHSIVYDDRTGRYIGVADRRRDGERAAVGR